jgi:hypothetical protein
MQLSGKKYTLLLKRFAGVALQQMYASINVQSEIQ